MTGVRCREHGVKNGDNVVDPRHPVLLKGGIEVTIDILQTTIAANPKAAQPPSQTQSHGILLDHRLI